MEKHHGRLSRLEKQEEFEVEEESFMLSPVTIQIEDGGGYQSDDQEATSPDTLQTIVTSQEESSDPSMEDKDRLTEYKHERRKSSRVKLLVRSHAVQDDASPPPDIESVIANTNMLSVTNAPSFVTQSKSSSSKLRLGNESSSQGSTESSSTSGISRDSSTETYTDPSGVDLQQFIVDTLHKNQKDRLMLLKIEQEMTALVKDQKRVSMKFPQMSSYNRMLVHRVAVFFGLDHYVDGNGTAVIVNKNKNTRLPDSHFQDFIRDELLPEEPKKSILKRDSISFEEGKEHRSPERQSSTDSRRSKSFEEREEEYEKARARIFNQDEGLGESPLNRSQEGTYCSSHRSSQEDVRWPSSDNRLWSSTDSDSSGRPPGWKVGGSFETENPTYGNKSSGIISKAESESKALHSSKSMRPAMTKASSFGGISVLSRENSVSRSFTPRIRKAESFNVATISSSPVPLVDDVPLDCEEDSLDPNTAPLTFLNQSTASCRNTDVPIITFPMSPDEAIENQTSIVNSHVDNTQTTSWPQCLSKELKEPSLLSASSQPLMWPYSTGSNTLYPGVFVNPLESSYQRLAYPSFQQLPFSSSEPTSNCSNSPGAVPTSVNMNSSLHSSPFTLQIQSPQGHLNTSSSSSPLYYIPYYSPIQTSVGNQSSSSAQNIRHPSQSAPLIADPRSLILFPFCYMPHTSSIHGVRHPLSKNATQQTSQCVTQSMSIATSNANVEEIKTLVSTVIDHLWSSKCSSFPALCYAQIGENSTSASTTVVFSHRKMNTGSTSSLNQSLFKTLVSSHPLQSPTNTQTSVLSQTSSSSLPPVYVSITCSTQTPATRTHAGGAFATQFSAMRSHSLPASSSSGSNMFSNSLNFSNSILGYTVYSPYIQSIPQQTQLPVTMNQAQMPAQESLLAPNYVSNFQVLQPNFPIALGNVGPPVANLLCPQYSAVTPGVGGKVPLSFPFVKQASDPGTQGNVPLPNFFLIGQSLQKNARSLLVPQQISSVGRLPQMHQSSGYRSFKTRKYRSRGNATNLPGPVNEVIFECEGKYILKINGFPEDMKRCNLEHYLRRLIEFSAKLHFLNGENMKVLDDENINISSKTHIVLAEFDSEEQAQTALNDIKTTKFELCPWKSFNS